MEDLDVFIRTYGYPALFGIMVVEQFVPPMPGEPVLLGAGALAGPATLLLRRRGISRIRPLAGGFPAWREHGFPVESLMSQLVGALAG